jgi:hypothetical protein
MGAGSGFAGALGQHPLSRGIEDLSAMSRGDINQERFVMSHIGRYTTNGLLSWMSALGDTVQRDPKTVEERILARTPARVNLPPRQDVLGRSLPNDMSAAGQSPLQAATNILAPFPARQQARDEPIIADYRRVGASIPKEAKEFFDTPLTREEAQDVQRLQGQLLQDYTPRIEKVLDRMKTPEAKKKALEQMTQELRDEAVLRAIKKTDFKERKKALDASRK